MFGLSTLHVLVIIDINVPVGNCNKISSRGYDINIRSEILFIEAPMFNDESSKRMSFIYISFFCLTRSLSDTFIAKLYFIAH